MNFIFNSGGNANPSSHATNCSYDGNQWEESNNEQPGFFESGIPVSSLEQQRDYANRRRYMQNENDSVGVLTHERFSVHDRSREHVLNGGIDMLSQEELANRLMQKIASLPAYRYAVAENTNVDSNRLDLSPRYTYGAAEHNNVPLNGNSMSDMSTNQAYMHGNQGPVTCLSDEPEILHDSRSEATSSSFMNTLTENRSSLRPEQNSYGMMAVQENTYDAYPVHENTYGVVSTEKSMFGFIPPVKENINSTNNPKVSNLKALISPNNSHVHLTSTGKPPNSIYNHPVIENILKSSNVKPSKHSECIPPVKENIPVTNIAKPLNLNASPASASEKTLTSRTESHRQSDLTRKINERVYSRCRPPDRRWNFCHTSFNNEMSFNNTIYFSGCSSKAELKDKSFAPVYESKYRHRHRDVAPPCEHYSDSRASRICKLLKSEDRFPEAARILIRWLENGECRKKNATYFYSMLQSAQYLLKRFQSDEDKSKLLLNDIRDMSKSKLDRVMCWCAAIKKIYETATLQRCSDHFTRRQRSNIKLWLKHIERLKNAVMELRYESGVADMELSDDDDDDEQQSPHVAKPDNQSKTDINKVQEEYDSFNDGQINDQLQSNVHNLQERNAALESEQDENTYVGLIDKQLETNICDLKKDNVSIDDENIDVKQINSHSNTNINKLQDENDSVDSVQQNIYKLQEENDSLRNQLKTTQNELKVRNKELAILQQDFENLKEELLNLKHKNSIDVEKDTELCTNSCRKQSDGGDKSILQPFDDSSSLHSTLSVELDDCR